MKSNPFATRFVVPGALAWQSQGGDDTVTQLQRRFTNHCNQRGAIIGPHGSGKTTLLEQLVPRLGSVCMRQYFDGTIHYATGNIIWLSLRRSSGLLNLHTQCWQPGQLLVVDGFEQLSLYKRAQVIWYTRVREMSLLVTAHRRCGIKLLHRTKTDFQLLERLAETATRQCGQEPRYTRTELAHAFTQSRGNLREAFMQLYDLHYQSDCNHSHQVNSTVEESENLVPVAAEADVQFN